MTVTDLNLEYIFPPFLNTSENVRGVINIANYKLNFVAKNNILIMTYE